MDHDKTDTFKPWSTAYSDTDILSLIHLSGDEDLQSRLRTLCTEFADIFSNELPKEPADILIPPFNLIVDDAKWKQEQSSSTISIQCETNCAIQHYTDVDQSRYSGEFSVTTLQSNPDGS